MPFTRPGTTFGWRWSFPYRGSFFGPRPFYTSFWYPSYFPYFGYSPTDYVPAQDAPAVVSEQDSSLAGQVEVLTREVESLREELESRDHARTAPAAPPSAIEERRLPTVFVYHNGKEFEAQNYAIVGQTLWVFTDQTATKIPLPDLDLVATKKLNDARGVDFSLPDMQ